MVIAKGRLVFLSEATALASLMASVDTCRHPSVPCPPSITPEEAQTILHGITMWDMPGLFGAFEMVRVNQTKSILTGGNLGSIFAELCAVQNLRHCKAHQINKNGTERLNMNELD